MLQVAFCGHVCDVRRALPFLFTQGGFDKKKTSTENKLQWREGRQSPVLHSFITPFKFKHFGIYMFWVVLVWLWVW